MTRKLLLADDNATIQRIVALTFANEDVEVVAVGDGDEAIARIPEERPDIVLATIAMPKRSGYDVAAFVKQTAGLSHVPVLLLAGAFEPVDEARVRRAGGDGVLVKPFEAQHVVARVRELVDKADRARQPAAGDPAGAGTLPPPQAAAVAGPQPPAAPPASDLDRYFEQLDAAFATLGNAPPPSAASADADDIIARLTRELDDGEMSVPTIDDILGGASVLAAPDPAVPSAHIAPPPPEPPDAPATIAAAPTPSATAAPPAAAVEPGANTIADVFRQLFAVEQGEREP